MKKIKNLYFRKIFTVLLFIGIIPVVILIIAVSSMTTAQMESLYKVQASSIHNKRRQIEVSLEYVDNSMIRGGLSRAIVESVRRPREARYFQDFNAANDQLKLLGALSFPVTDTILVSSQQRWIMSQQSFQPISESVYGTLVEQLEKIPKSSFWHYSDLYIYLVERIPVNVSTGNGMLISIIDKKTIYNELNGENQNEQVVILDENENCIVGAAGTEAVVEYIKASGDIWAALQEGLPQQITFYNENYVCAVSRSEFNDWTYVSVILNSDLKKGMESVYRLVWTVIASMIFILLTLVYCFSKVLYRPIDVLNELVDNSLSDGDKRNLDSITSKVHYLVEKNVELKKRISDTEESNREIYLRKIYRNEPVAINTQELIRHKVITDPIDGRHIHVIAVKFYLTAENKKDAEIYVFGVKNIIAELMGMEDSFVPVAIDQVIYITHYKEYMSAEGALLQLQRTCEMVVLAIARYTGLQVNIGISRQVFSVEQLPTAVEECKSALRKAIGRSGVCIFSGINEGKGVVLSEIRIKQKRLQIIQSVLEGTEEQCKEHLDAYFGNLDGVDYYLFKLEVNKLLSDVLDCYNEYSLQPDYGKMKEIADFDITKDIDSIEKLKLYFWEYFLKPLNQKVKEPAESQRVITQILEYLNQNLEEDISLEQCARHFNYNPNYLSRMFKKQFGKTYTEYVIDKKLKRCKELLSETDLSIQEISVRMGYNSPQNFIRVFKKYTLITPGQYRNQFKGKKELSE
ncbi:MAG: helix-turn-helix domain-containing protein [Lacrimispora sphenoides]